MQQIITPRNAITLVLTAKSKDFRLKLYETTFQMVCFIGAIGLLSLGSIVGVIFRNIPSCKPLGWVALILISLSSIAAMAYNISQLIPDVAKLKNPEKEASSPLLKDFNDDMDLINGLAKSFETHHLSYAKVMYANMARQMRERIGLLVGSLDKVGLIPIFLTAYLSYAKAIKEGIAFGPVEWISIALVLLYLFAIRMVSTAQWMESISEIYDHAIMIKTSSKQD
ncbi:hypothetical protein ICN48_00665 [Polynucleobacter sp. JS-Safj-400b-B2]|uniref:hypothetical protein n=1 Tax=Polynucleobacter sp. JS-Safj-400b-B2 TaxID=2576921 RepID=UPI001C0BED17|nr:hypothetical protein [Polynucleobacter sp. JS-Safj-400b-B2]MBU3624752.1 hypothetical protein [Polynucleobacter sp. JS-Safj-400b-B2]